MAILPEPLPEREYRQLTVAEYRSAMPFHGSDYDAVDWELICRIAGMSQDALDELPDTESYPYEVELGRQCTPFPYVIDADRNVRSCNVSCQCGHCIYEIECAEDADDGEIVATLPEIMTTRVRRLAGRDEVKLVSLLCGIDKAAMDAMPLRAFKTLDYAVKRRFLAHRFSIPTRRR